MGIPVDARKIGAARSGSKGLVSAARRDLIGLSE